MPRTGPTYYLLPQAPTLHLAPLPPTPLPPCPPGYTWVPAGTYTIYGDTNLGLGGVVKNEYFGGGCCPNGYASPLDGGCIPPINVPPTYNPCQPGWSYNAAAKQCCPPGWHYDAYVEQCVKNGTPKVGQALRVATPPTLHLQPPAPSPVMHFLIYAWIPPVLSFEKLGWLPGRWEQMTGLFPAPKAEELCQFFWDHDKARTYRVFWNLGPGTATQVMAGGDRTGSKWFDDLGCYHLGWWAPIDWNKLAGPH